MKQKTILLFAILLLIGVSAGMQSCKQCNKGNKNDKTVTTDSTAASNFVPSNTINTPHGDTSLIPVLGGLLDQAFEASRQKDYATLASLIVYRGTDSLRHGTDVFRLKNNYEKGVIRLTAGAFSKWIEGVHAVDYSRVFELPQPDGRSLEVLEVIFVHPKRTERKFFGFLLIKNEYKIADVTSWL